MGCITSSDADSLPKSAVVEIKMISVIAPPKVELFRVDRVLNLLKDLNLSVEDQTQYDEIFWFSVLCLILIFQTWLVARAQIPDCRQRSCRS